MLRKGLVALVTMGAVTMGGITSASAEPLAYITAYDFGYTGVPKVIDKGEVQFTFKNSSSTTGHEIFFVHIRDGATLDEVRAGFDQVYYTGVVDETLFFDQDGTGGFAGGDKKTVHPGFGYFPRGTYAYGCFFNSRNSDTPHYQLGMIGILKAH